MKRLITYIFILLCVVIPSKVFAYGIENYYINATLENNGDLLVEEYFYLNDEFNGMQRIINYKNSSAYAFNINSTSYGGSTLHNGNGIELLEVRGLEIDENFNFENINGDIFSKVNSADKGSYQVYTLYKTYNGIDLKIFLPSYKNKAFYIKYRLKNMAILHNDIGELGWNVIGNELSESISNLVVYVNIPNNENVRVWGHGPLNGKTEIISNELLKLSVEGLSSYTAVDLRTVFDKEVINNSTKKTNINALDKILLYETDLAEQANYERQMKDYNNIDFINSLFDNFENYPKRSTYNTLEEYINDLSLEDIKNEYLAKLVTYQNKVDEFEYQEFKNYLINTYDENNSYYNYTDYSYAKETINNVFDDSLKNKMNNELNVLTNKLKNSERKTEIKYIILSLISLLVTIVIYMVNNYKHKLKTHSINPEYLRDFPSELPAECVGLLIDNKITKSEVSAALLELIRRKVITFERIDNNSFDFIINDSINLTTSDSFLIKLIFGNKKRINSKKIKKIKAKDFNNWKKSVLKKLEQSYLIKKYKEKYDTVNGGLLYIGIVLTISTIFSFFGIVLLLIYFIKKYRETFIIWAFIPLNIIFIILSLALNHFTHISIIFSIISLIIIKILLKKIPHKITIFKTNLGKEERKKWLALKNFLIDFSNIPEREIPEIELWEKYLVYATAFGIGDKVLKQMKIKIDNEIIDDNILNSYIILSNVNEINNLVSSVSNFSNNIVAASIPKTDYSSFSSGGSTDSSSSNYSSGSGSGGGFSGGSSGGGSFGGGGGGGRF